MNICNKLNETKVIRDPIYSYVQVDYQIIWDLLATFEMQRLRRILQLAGTNYVFPSCEHTRFVHSLGVYEVARKIITTVEDIKNSLNEEEKVQVLCAALLHDVGHGPYSHCFENFHEVSHEEYTKLIILDESSEVNKVLRRYDENLPSLIASIIDHSHSNPLLYQLISSQIDADRMDYLLRDAYMSGTPYGSFDVNRIMRIMKVKDQNIVFKKSGVSAIENYIMGRYHMYEQVYYHPVSTCAEIIFLSFLRRIKELFMQNYQFNFDILILKPFLKDGRVSVKDYVLLDDVVVNYYLKQAVNEKDEILSDLAKRLVYRKLFDYKVLTNENELNAIKEEIKSKGYNPDYYVASVKLRRNIYKKYGDVNYASINIILDDGSVKEITKVSQIVNAISASKIVKSEDTLVYFPLIKES